jgi:heme exporter protein CcmD
MNLGPHTAFIFTAYVAVGAIVIALIAWVTSDHRRQLRTLRELEAEGIVRRSAPPAPERA